MALQLIFQLEADVEMIFDGRLAAAGHDDDVLNARMEGLLDAVLDERLIHQRQHFLGLRFGGGQEAGAEPRGGEDGLAYFGGHHSTVCGTAGVVCKENLARKYARPHRPTIHFGGLIDDLAGNLARADWPTWHSRPATPEMTRGEGEKNRSHED